MKWSKAIERFSNYETLLSSGEWKNMLTEMVLQLVAPYSFLEGIKYIEYVEAFDITIYYELNELLLAFSFVRIYMIIKMYIYYSDSLTPRTLRVCQMNGCESNIMFAIKSFIKS